MCQSILLLLTQLPTCLSYLFLRLFTIRDTFKVQGHPATFYDQDVTIIFSKRSPENFIVETKRPLESSNETTAAQCPRLSTGAILARKPPKAKTSEQINQFLGRLQINQTGF